jgi:hypothetical protein
MTPKIHVHLAVTDIERSSAFHAALFGRPVKVKPGYRKFLPEFAPLNLALSESAASPVGGPNHLGVQFDTAAEVTSHLARAKAAGLPVREEIGISCCHANQDKFWVRDPDGTEWEFYVLNFDIEEPVPSGGPTGCCSADASGARSTDGSTCAS